ncbi:MAG: cyclic nucleotide-binding domain-containing protein [Desulfococcaceae bacterium]
MNIPETILRIVRNRNCPLYDQDDVFTLIGRSLTPPQGKATCMVLVGDIKADLADADLHGDEAGPIHQFECSGPDTDCVGEIRMEMSRGGEAAQRSRPAEGRKAPRKEKLKAMIGVLAKFEIFKDMNVEELGDLGSYLKFRSLNAGETVVRQGDPGVNLYLIASGRVAVIGEDGVRLAELERGEVFGEMSLISGEPAAATIEVAEPTRLLYIKGRDFGRLLKRYPSLQMYFARLLASRLVQTNTAQAEMLRAGMTGRLEDVAPSELFQAFNVNSKSGALSLSLAFGAGRVAFRDGGLVGAAYDGKTGVDAFFAILAETKGRFSYQPDLTPEEAKAPEIGDFMWLLMEGVRRIDEAKEGA